MAIVEAIFRIRRGTAAAWTAANPVLKLGEPGLETGPPAKVKYGDGATAWNSLPYSSATVAWADVTGVPAGVSTIAALTPAADRLPYYTGAGAASLATFTAAGRALVDDADDAAQRTTLGLGTMATQGAGAVAITGGVVSGLTNASVGAITDFTSSGVNAKFAVDGTINLPDNAFLAWGGGTGRTYIQGSKAAGTLSIGLAGTTILSFSSAVASVFGALRPGTDNTRDLGSASLRWGTVYAGTGAINTSDARDKRDVGAIPDEWLDAWADVEWSRFKFKDGERWHVGLVAQQVRDAFADRGLDAREIGLLCYDEWEATRAVRAKRDRQGNLIRHAQPGRAAGNRWGLRYDECQAMEAAYMRRELKRLAAR